MNINCKGKLIDISSPKVMGILNLTPDSFYDGDMYNNEKTILNQVEKMLNEHRDPQQPSSSLLRKQLHRLFYLSQSPLQHHHLWSHYSLWMIN